MIARRQIRAKVRAANRKTLVNTPEAGSPLGPTAKPSAHSFGRIGVVGAKPATVQPKLTASRPGDTYELEADRVADQVMRMPKATAPFRRLRTESSRLDVSPLIQRQVNATEEEEEDEDVLQAKGLDGQTAVVTPGMAAGVDSVVESGGAALDPLTRGDMESRFGYDFGSVKVHTGADAAESARSVNARAYTIGRDIVFGAGQYRQGSTEASRLLAHELAHVVQQTGAGGAPGAVRLQLASEGTRLITPDVERAMRADIDTIVTVLKSAVWVTPWEEGDIVEMIEGWAEEDRVLSSSGDLTNGTPYLDKFIWLLKMKTYKRTTVGSMGIEQHRNAFDDLWLELEDERGERFAEIVSLSTAHGDRGPMSEAPENPWETLAKQEAIGAWGVLKGMGVGVASMSDAGAWAITTAMQALGIDVAEPASAAKWLAEQYDISGDALFGAEYSEGEALFLGKNAREIGTVGGQVIHTLVMVGAGTSASGTTAGTALVTLGVAASLKGVQDSATKMADIIEAMRQDGDLSVSNLLTNGAFILESTKLAASIFGAVSGGTASRDEVAEATAAALTRIGLLLDAAQVTAGVSRVIEIQASDMTPDEKEAAAGDVMVDVVVTVVGAAAGVASDIDQSRAASEAAAGEEASAPVASEPEGESAVDRPSATEEEPSRAAFVEESPEPVPAHEPAEPAAMPVSAEAEPAGPRSADEPTELAAVTPEAAEQQQAGSQSTDEPAELAAVTPEAAEHQQARPLSADEPTEVATVTPEAAEQQQGGSQSADEPTELAMATPEATEQEPALAAPVEEAESPTSSTEPAIEEPDVAAPVRPTRGREDVLGQVLDSGTDPPTFRTPEGHLDMEVQSAYQTYLDRKGIDASDVPPHEWIRISRSKARQELREKHDLSEAEWALIARKPRTSGRRRRREKSYAFEEQLAEPGITSGPTSLK